MYTIIARQLKYQQPNGFIFGGSCSGRAIHPWDGLKNCPKCRGYPWFVGKDGKDFHSGSPYKIICSNHNCDCQSIQSNNIELCRDDWNGKGFDSMKKYRLGYSYLFLSTNELTYNDEKIGALTINVVFKVYGKSGEELLYNDTNDHAVYILSDRKVYACNLFRCSVLNKENLFEFIPQPEFLKPLGNVSFEIVDYTKELVTKENPYTLSPTYISKEEFEDIFRNNFESFDTTNNKSAQVTSYFTQEVEV